MLKTETLKCRNVHPKANFTDLMRSSPSWARMRVSSMGFICSRWKRMAGWVTRSTRMAVFHRDRLGVAGNEVSGEFLPRGADLVFVQAILGTGGPQDGGDEILGGMDAGIEIGGLVATTPFLQNLLADCTGARLSFHRRPVGAYSSPSSPMASTGQPSMASRHWASFLVVFGLFEDVGVALVFGTGEIVRCGFAAEVAVDALAVHIEFASNVFGVFVFAVSHGVGC